MITGCYDEWRKRYFLRRDGLASSVSEVDTSSPAGATTAPG